MKALLVYWVIGCAVVGFPTGSLIKECPSSKIEFQQVLTAVVVWPAILFASLSAGKVKGRSCEDAGA